MSDLKSLGLKTRRRKDGRLDIVGKQDDGKEYVARVAGAEITPVDMQALHESDREHNTARQYVARQVERQRVKSESENLSLDEWTEAALPVAEAGVGMIKFGYSARYAAAFERIKWDIKFTA